MQNDSDKLFDEWNELKKNIHHKSRGYIVKEGDVWWCSVGENIGIEINGKHELYLRPVVVLKKLSRFGFMGIPLTSQYHIGAWYTRFIFKGKTEYAVLAQARVFSVLRTYRRMGQLPKTDLELIRDGFIKLYSKNAP